MAGRRLDRTVGNLVLEKIRLKQQTGMGEVDPRSSSARGKPATRSSRSCCRTSGAARYSDGNDLISMAWRDIENLFGPDWEEIDLVGLLGGIWEGGPAFDAKQHGQRHLYAARRR